MKRLTNLAYSDDVVLLSNSTGHAQQQFALFQHLAASIGMRVNVAAGKTEEIRLNAPVDDPKLRTLDGREVGIVNEYKYLGTVLGRTWLEDFKRRTGLAWAVIRTYRQVWASRAPMDVKQQLFQALAEPALSYGAFTYPQKAEVDDVLHSTHTRMLRHCLGLPKASVSLNAGHVQHFRTEWLYYGTDQVRGKSLKSATLTLPAKVLRQRLSALGHWVRDHYYREQLEEGNPPNRKHPVIDVLRFRPSDNYLQHRGGVHRTVQDTYTEAVNFDNEPQLPGDDLLRSTVLHAEHSTCADKHRWYDLSKEKVKQVDRRLLHSNMNRRHNDVRRNYGGVEFGNDTRRLDDGKVFTLRWLTRRTRENRLGEDREE